MFNSQLLRLRWVYLLLSLLITFGFSGTLQARNENRPPAKGMSREEVRDFYGRNPDHVEMSDEGETWIYIFGKAKAFIPYYGPFAKMQTVVVIFSPRGRVRSWHWSENRW